jgi:hypothetical protein
VTSGIASPLIPRDARARRPRQLGWTKLLALAVAVGFGVAFVWANARSWNLEDMDAYWNAGLRLREGLPLYPVVADPGAPDVFRYAPWFAWLWVPLTYLPKVAVQIGWSALLIASVAFVVRSILRPPSAAAACLAALMGGLLVRTASTGNVHALLIAALMYGLPRRGAPVWIGIAASLKFAPIAFALVYLGRGEWKRAAISALVTALLVAPALLYDLSAYPLDPGRGFSLLSIAGPVPWAVVALAFAVGAVVLARGGHAWLAASVAVLAGIPRLQLYDLTYLVACLGGQSRPRLAMMGRGARDDRAIQPVRGGT